MANIFGTGGVQWSETVEWLYLRIPFDEIVVEDLNITLTSRYMRVSQTPHFWECFLYAAIDPERSTTHIENKLLSLKLFKTRKCLWGSLRHGQTGYERFRILQRDYAVKEVLEKALMNQKNKLPENSENYQCTSVRKHMELTVEEQKKADEILEKIFCKKNPATSRNFVMPVPSVASQFDLTWHQSDPLPKSGNASQIINQKHSVLPQESQVKPAKQATEGLPDLQNDPAIYKASEEELKTAIRKEVDLPPRAAIKLYQDAYNKLLLDVVVPNMNVDLIANKVKKAQFCYKRIQLLKECEASTGPVVELARNRELFVRRLEPNVDLLSVKQELYGKFPDIKNFETLADKKYHGFLALYIKCYSSSSANVIFSFMKSNLNLFKNHAECPRSPETTQGSDECRGTPMEPVSKRGGSDPVAQSGSWVTKLEAFKSRSSFL